MNIDILINAVRKLESRAISRPLSVREERQLTAFFTEAYDKLLYNPSSEIFGTQKVIGKHKLPRYMYHITTEDAYLSMLKDGKMSPAQCMDSASGIFLFDLKNFTRFWRQSKKVSEQPRTTLLAEVAGKLGFKTTGNVVMLRISTKDLDARTLRLRRQKLLRCGHGNIQQEQEAMLNDKFKFSNSLEYLKYSMQGESVAKAPLYNQRKEAIEFITPNEIPMTNVSLVGKVNVDTEILDKAHWNIEDLPNIWKIMTKNTPEQKAFNYMI